MTIQEKLDKIVEFELTNWSTISSWPILIDKLFLAQYLTNRERKLLVVVAKGHENHFQNNNNGEFNNSHILLVNLIYEKIRHTFDKQSKF